MGIGLLFKRNLGGIGHGLANWPTLGQPPGQSHVLQSSGFRCLRAGLARLAKVAMLRSLQRSSALRLSRSFPRRHVNRPVFIDWRLTMSRRGLERVPSPRYSGKRVRVRGLFPAAVKRKHLVEFLGIHQKMNCERIANCRR